MARRDGRKRKGRRDPAEATEPVLEPERTPPEASPPTPGGADPETAPRSGEAPAEGSGAAPGPRVRTDVPLNRWTAGLAQRGEAAARLGAETAARSEAKLDGYFLELVSWLSSWQHTLELRQHRLHESLDRQARRRQHRTLLLAMAVLFALVFAGLVWVIRTGRFPVGP